MSTERKKPKTHTHTNSITERQPTTSTNLRIHINRRRKKGRTKKTLTIKPKAAKEGEKGKACKVGNIKQDCRNKTNLTVILINGNGLNPLIKSWGLSDWT